MKISLKHVSKRFNEFWIFENITFEFDNSFLNVIKGSNGSGKSTLLKLLINYSSPTKGEILWENKKLIDKDQLQYHYALATPYLDLIEEMTIEEMCQFYFSTWTGEKPNIIKCLEEFELIQNSKTEIHLVSTGMKQRLKLVLAMNAPVDVVILDEPTSNLDSDGVRIYRNKLQNLIQQNKLIIVATNQEHDYLGEVRFFDLNNKTTF